jgi:recombination protein RecT
VLSIEADVVYDGDEWDCRKTEMGTSFTHVPCEDDDPGAVRLAYAVARLKDSPVPVVVVMLRRQIDAVRDRETRFGDSPWSSDYAEMAKKSSIRRICKYLPMSIEMASCLDAEAEEEAREIIDVRPAAVLKPDFRKKPESSQQTGDSSDVISGPPPQQTQVDTSESQEEQQEVIDNLSDVLAGIAALRTGAECNEHNERLRVAHWASEYDRKTAAAALKARWAVILKEEKLAMKSATNSKQAEPAKEPAKEATKEPARCDGCDLIGTHAVGCPQNEPAKPEWAKQDEKRSAEEASKAYSAVAPKGESVRVKLSDGTYADEGDEIQGRDREPGQEG